MGKGSEFERAFSKELSLWWTDGERDDIFWRSSQSGGRATTRAQRGRRTATQSGDICAIDPIGQPLIAVMTLELKRGYRDANPATLVTRATTAAQQVWESWIQQAVEACERNESQHWMVVAKQDRQEVMCMAPRALLRALDKQLLTSITPLARMRCGIRFRKADTQGDVRIITLPFDLVLLPWEQFRTHITPAMIRILADDSKQTKN